MRFFQRFSICCAVLLLLCGCVAGRADSNADDHRSAPQPESATLVEPDTPTPLLSAGNMLRQWTTLGSFLSVYGEENPLRSSLHYEYLADENTLSPRRKTPPYLEWRSAGPVENQPMACDFDASWPEAKVIYAVKQLRCERELRNTTLFLGSSGFIKVWLNGALVHTYDREARIGTADQGRVDGLILRRGDNELVVKTVRTGEIWNLFARLEHQGHALLVVEPKSPLLH